MSISSMVMSIMRDIRCEKCDDRIYCLTEEELQKESHICKCCLDDQTVRETMSKIKESYHETKAQKKTGEKEPSQEE